MESDGIPIIALDRSSFQTDLDQAVSQAGFIVHLAGENRASDEVGFEVWNVTTTERLIAAVKRQGRAIPIIYASSRQAVSINSYGLSKRRAEYTLQEFSAVTQIPVVIYRLPGVFGKWCRPNYNSVVATFCHDVARGVEPDVFGGERELNLVYVDDVIDDFLAVILAFPQGFQFRHVAPEYRITVFDLLETIKSFRSCRSELLLGNVGLGLTRALYSTYVSYLPKDNFSYPVPVYSDPRGVFVEMIKTTHNGQVSFFTAHPGVTRGGHYHHTKTEKFLVIRGTARFRFRHILTDEVTELVTFGHIPVVVDTIPGWAHDITNIGSDELVVLLWANEIFDRDRPDTVAARV
jgi:UDP-2-acetamido-2,6-beta-L-arabino-hexul-4-ose reductase